MVSASQAKYVNSLLLTCGTYDAVGDFVYCYQQWDYVGTLFDLVDGLIEHIEHAQREAEQEVSDG